MNGVEIQHNQIVQRNIVQPANGLITSRNSIRKNTDFILH